MMKKISEHEIKGLIPHEKKEDQQQGAREKEAMRYWSSVVNEMLANNPRWAFKDNQQQANYTKSLMLGAKEAKIKSQSDVERALKHLRVGPCRFMPSVGEFITMCRSPSETAGLTHNTQAYSNDWTGESKKLDYKRSAEQKAQAKSKIAGLKDLLKK